MCPGSCEEKAPARSQSPPICQNQKGAAAPTATRAAARTGMGMPYLLPFLRWWNKWNPCPKICEKAEPAHQGPTTWKQSLIVLVALYPLIVILGFLVPQILPDAHPLTIRLLCAVIAVGLMGFFVVPRLARLLQPWIVATGFWPQFAGAIALIGGLLLLWLALHAFYPENPSEDRAENCAQSSLRETAGSPQRAALSY